MDDSLKSKEELLEELKKLKEKEKNVSHILNNVGEMFYKISFNENGRKVIDFISPQVEEVFGLSEQEYRDNQHRLFEYFHLDEIENLRKKILNINESTKNWSVEYRFYNKKKEKYVWIEETITAIFSEDGKKEGLFGTARDITYKIESEQKIDFILENIDECIYNIRFNEKGPELVYISPQIKKLTGLSIDEYNKEGKSGKLIKRIHPDDIDYVNKNIEEGLYKRKKTLISTVFRFKPKGKKEYIWLDEALHAKYDKTGKVIETTTVVRDITKEKKHQDELKKSEQKLNIISNSTNEVVLIHEKGIIKEINNAVITMFGYKPIEIIGKSVLEFTAKEFQETVKKNVTKNSTKPFEAKAIKKNGEVFSVEVKSKTIKWENKEIRVTTITDLTPSKLAEQRLKENKQLYKSLFINNMAGVFVTENNIIINCNQSFAKIYGYNNYKELIGKKAEELYLSKKERQEYIHKLKKDGFLSNYLLRNKTINGDEKWILTNVSLTDKKNQRIEGTLIDITNQVLKENRLKQSEKNYKQLIEKAPYGTIIIIDEEIEYINPRAEKILGIKEKKKKNSLFDFIVPEYHELIKKRQNELNKNKIELDFIDIKIHNSTINKNIEIEATSLLVEYEGKKAIQFVFQDISDKKQLAKERLKSQIIEESNKNLQNEILERKKVENQLITNQNYINSIISSSLDIICASDENGAIKEFNKAAELAFGYKKEEVLGKHISMLYQSKNKHGEIRKQLIEKGSFTGEIINIKKDGEPFNSFLSSSILYNDEGKIAGTMGISRDITDLKLAEKQLIESEEKYRDLFENASDLIQSVDGIGKISYVNKAWLRTLGYSLEEIENKMIFDFIHPDSIKHCQDFFENITKKPSKESVRITFELISKTNQKVIVEGNISCKFDSNNKAQSTRAILRDVTEESWAKFKQTIYNNILKIISDKTNAEELYEAIRIELGKVFNTNIFVISYAYNKDSISFPYYYDKERDGRIYRPNRIRQKGINEYFLKQRTAQILKREQLDEIIQQGKYELLGPKCQVFVGVPLKVKNKIIGVLSVQSYDNKDEYDEKTIEILEFISGTIALAVQRKYDEQLLFDQSSKLKSIIENSTHLFWTFEKGKGLTTFNQNFSDAIYDLYGKRPVLNSKTKTRVEAKHLHAFWDEKYDKAFSGKKVEFITERINKNGEKTIREVFLNPIFNEDGEVSSVSGIAHDITEKKLAEDKLIESLKEKEILLKEVHHRVKNNLQVISSILNLQSSYIEDSKILSILKESQNRIKSMSIIHESLYQTNDFSKINFSEYLVSLSKNLVHSYGQLDKLIDVQYNIDDVSLSLDTSIPCGLIVNELISNALKYAFKDRKKGKIKIDLLSEDGNFVLTIADDGIGFPKEINFRDTNSLGLQLVNTLIEQIDGTIEMENKKGTKYTIIFKKN